MLGRVLEDNADHPMREIGQSFEQLIRKKVPNFHRRIS
jgi:hypothetical protein